MKKIFSLFCLIIVLNELGFAQSSLGVNCNLEANRDFYTLNPLVGIKYKQNIKKGSVSVGLLLRTFTNKFTLIATYPGNSQPDVANYDITSYYLSIPLLYQYNTKIINFAIGPSYDIYVGYRSKTNSKTLKVTNFKAPNEWGMVLNINKDFKFLNDFEIVPEVRFQRVFESKTSFYSVGCGLNYNFRK